jgi:hypothetical protein
MVRRMFFSAMALMVSVSLTQAADFEFAGLKAKLPEGWKEETPSNSMRLAQYKLPKADGEKDDAELAIFKFPGGSGSVDANLKRQVDKFTPLEGKEKVEAKTSKIKIGELEATYQDVTGNFKKKAFPMAKDFTEVPNYRQLYVIVLTEKGEYYITLLGSSKTVEKHRDTFEKLIKSLK